MKATVIVTLKPTVLDPQGMTIHRSLSSLGLTDVTDVRQGKIFNLQLKDGNGIEILRETKRRYPEIRFIVFTNQCELQYRQRCLELGADYFLCKSTEARSLVSTTKDLSTVSGH